MGHGSRIWHKWKSIARKVGEFQARVILVLFYFIILAPFSLLVRLSDPLALRKKTRGWEARDENRKSTVESALQQW